jgi:hypothetical protein
MWFKLGRGNKTNSRLKKQCAKDCYNKWVDEKFPFANTIIEGGHKPYGNIIIN